MILYIAGPMSGIKDLNYPHFREVAERLTVAGFEVLDPSTIDDQFPIKHEEGCITINGDGPSICTCGALQQRGHAWYMRKAVGMLVNADGIALLRGWERSRGAAGEAMIGELMGMEKMMWYDWAARKYHFDKIKEKEA